MNKFTLWGFIFWTFCHFCGFYHQKVRFIISVPDKDWFQYHKGKITVKLFFSCYWVFLFVVQTGALERINTSKQLDSQWSTMKHFYHLTQPPKRIYNLYFSEIISSVPLTGSLAIIDQTSVLFLFLRDKILDHLPFFNLERMQVVLHCRCFNLNW